MAGFCDVILINGVFHDHFIRWCTLTSVGQLCTVSKTTFQFVFSEITWEILYRMHLGCIPHTDLNLTWLESFKTNHAIIRRFATRFAVQCCIAYSHLPVTRRLIRVIHTSIRENMLVLQNWNVANLVFIMIFKSVYHVVQIEARGIPFDKQFRAWNHSCRIKNTMLTLIKELFETFGFSVDRVTWVRSCKFFYSMFNTRL